MSSQAGSPTANRSTDSVDLGAESSAAVGTAAAVVGTAAAVATVGPVQIEPMRRRHLRAIRAIDKLVYPRPWSLALYLDELSRPDNRLYLVARATAPVQRPPLAPQKQQHPPPSKRPNRDNAVLGYVGLIAVAGEGHISSVAVHPSAQGQGVGTALMLALHRAVHNRCLPDGEPVGRAVREVTDLTLEVRVSNRSAQSLYTRFGYAPVGSRAGYYRGILNHHSEDALVMWCHDVDGAEHGDRLDCLAVACL